MIVTPWIDQKAHICIEHLNNSDPLTCVPAHMRVHLHMHVWAHKLMWVWKKGVTIVVVLDANVRFLVHTRRDNHFARHLLCLCSSNKHSIDSTV